MLLYIDFCLVKCGNLRVNYLTEIFCASYCVFFLQNRNLKTNVIFITEEG